MSMQENNWGGGRGGQGGDGRGGGGDWDRGDGGGRGGGDWGGRGGGGDNDWDRDGGGRGGGNDWDRGRGGWDGRGQHDWDRNDWNRGGHGGGNWFGNWFGGDWDWWDDDRDRRGKKKRKYGNPWYNKRGRHVNPYGWPYQFWNSYITPYLGIGWPGAIPTPPLPTPISYRTQPGYPYNTVTPVYGSPYYF